MDQLEILTNRNKHLNITGIMGVRGLYVEIWIILERFIQMIYHLCKIYGNFIGILLL